MKSRLFMVFGGILLGLLGKVLLWPLADPQPPARFDPAPELEPADILIDNSAIELQRPGRDQQGLVPPLAPDVVGRIDPGLGSAEMIELSRRRLAEQFDRFDHGERAVFHAHGEEICASGCAASRHPTETLTLKKFRTLLAEFEASASTVDESRSEVDRPGLDPDSNMIVEHRAALDQLVYYGPQTLRMLDSVGTGNLTSAQTELLRRELRRTHALIEIRVVDEHGDIRTWLPSTRVPLDRRHVFEMEVKNLQPLITSGTVKRVGLDYLWVRL